MKKNIFLIFLFSLNIAFAQDKYTVAKGDTLYKISKNFNISVEDIIKLNDIKDITSITVGTVLNLTIENPRESNNNIYVVEKGDTLFSISKKFNLPLSSLMEYNKLTSGDIISLGQKLVVAFNEVAEVGIVATNTEKVIVDSESLLPYWPIDGDIIKYSGRIQGVKIEGNSGDYIQAVSAGRVIWYDSFKGIGKVVLIEGDNGFDYLYGTQEELNVSMGLKVDAGERLGRLKESNTSIIFSVFKNGKPISDISKAPR